MCETEEINHNQGDYYIIESGITCYMTFFCDPFQLLILFSCEIGQRHSNAYEEVNDIIDQFGWHLFPMKIERILPIIMINTQKPSEIMCFRSIPCLRATFRSVKFCLYNPQYRTQENIK